MTTGGTVDASSATIIAAAVGASAALGGTFITLVITRWLDNRRWVREREHRETIERRAAYAKMSRTAAVWREATVDLIGKPSKKDWNAYWAARLDALEAAHELLLIGTPLAIETIDEALDQLLDVWWDYENNGPWAVESGPLWSRMAYIDARLRAFTDLARAEFDLEPAVEDPRAWIETPELVQRRAEELRARSRRRERPPKETEPDARARRAFEVSMYAASRAGTARRLELQDGLTEAEANTLIDRWEAEASTRGLARDSADYWRQAGDWMREQVFEGKRRPG